MSQGWGTKRITGNDSSSVTYSGCQVTTVRVTTMGWPRHITGIVGDITQEYLCNHGNPRSVPLNSKRIAQAEPVTESSKFDLAVKKEAIR